VDELTIIVERSARLLAWHRRRCRQRVGAPLPGNAAHSQSAAARVPTTRKCAPTAASRRRGADRAEPLEVDRFALRIDQKIMLTILEKYRGGPVG